jgi:hypothetical protein
MERASLLSFFYQPNVPMERKPLYFIVFYQPNVPMDRKEQQGVRQLADTLLVEISQHIDFCVPWERLVIWNEFLGHILHSLFYG